LLLLFVRGRLRLGEISLECVELPFPELTIAFDPLSRVLHRLRHQAAAVHATIPVPPDEARAFEHAQMLRYGGERHFVRRCKLADGSFAERQPREDAAAGGVGERRESGVEHSA
jgi:hypothetical protein